MIRVQQLNYQDIIAGINDGFYEGYDWYLFRKKQLVKQACVIKMSMLE